jgi:hypothetical protein
MPRSSAAGATTRLAGAAEIGPLMDAVAPCFGVVVDGHRENHLGSISVEAVDMRRSAQCGTKGTRPSLRRAASRGPWRQLRPAASSKPIARHAALCRRCLELRHGSDSAAHSTIFASWPFYHASNAAEPSVATGSTACTGGISGGSVVWHEQRRHLRRGRKQSVWCVFGAGHLRVLPRKHEYRQTGHLVTPRVPTRPSHWFPASLLGGGENQRSRSRAPPIG